MPDGPLSGLAPPTHGYRVWLSEVDPLLDALGRLGRRPNLVWTTAAVITALEHEAAEVMSRRLPRKSFVFRPAEEAVELFESALLAVRRAAGGAHAELPGPGSCPSA